MTERQLARRKAIMQRRIILGVCFAVLALIAVLIVFIVTSVVSAPDTNGTSSTPVSSTESESSQEKTSSDAKPTEPDYETVGEYTLNADFSMLLLVNGDNPLPDDYDSNIWQELVEIDPQYRNNNNVTQIHKDVYPYITAMVATAQKDGVDLKVWSPFRSYAIQKDLFQKQVNRVGGDEEKAATVVARPGTSEHNTGLCADFNMASDAFENTQMYEWMTENAENFGFVMRYREDKQSITGVIHESWHWRFVGIKHARKMNDLDMCLEEYLDYLEETENK